MSSPWIQVAVEADCPPGAAIEIVVEDRLVALFNLEGTFYALDGVCPHQGGPLAKGVVTGCIVACPWHGWQFDVSSGQHQSNARLRQPTFAVQVKDGVVFIMLESSAS